MLTVPDSPRGARTLWGNPGSDDLLRTMRSHASEQSDELLDDDDDEADPGDAWKNPWPKNPSPEGESSDRPRPRLS